MDGVIYKTNLETHVILRQSKFSGSIMPAAQHLFSLLQAIGRCHSKSKLAYCSRCSLFCILSSFTEVEATTDSLPPHIIFRPFTP
jgi:hypothetical protein